MKQNVYLNIVQCEWKVGNIEVSQNWESDLKGIFLSCNGGEKR
jgi:hypothetical protein